MPEFILDRGTAEASKRFRALDAFTQGYIEAAFWVGIVTEDGHNDDSHSFAELTPEAFTEITGECADFQTHNADLLDTAQRHESYTMHRAGVDFFLTRNRHGAGFWDRGLGEVGDRLTEAAHPYGSQNLYVGDDGKLHAMAG